MSDWWNQPTPPAIQPRIDAAAPPARCPSCDAPAAPAATYCPCCGAVIAQREDLGGIVIAGVTAIDPAAQAAANSSLATARAGLASITMVGAAGGASAGLVVAGTLLARDSLGASRPDARAEDLGNPSQAALEMARRLREAEGPAADTLEPGSTEQGSTRPPTTRR